MPPLTSLSIALAAGILVAALVVGLPWLILVRSARRPNIAKEHLVRTQWHTDHEVELEFLDGSRFRGFSTVWYREPECVRADTLTESALADVYEYVRRAR